jgi:biotin transport system substrate-specific component
VSFTPTLAQRLFPQRSIAREVGVQFAAIGLVSALAQLSVDIWPVPVTGQTLGVLLVGSFLGFRRGSLAMLLYVGLGSAGLPLFAGFRGGFPAYSGGYLLGFVLSAGTIGLLAEHGFLRTYLRTALAMSLATIPVFVLGVAWLMHYVTPGEAARSGFLIFVPGAIAKIAVATAIAGRR